MIKPTVKLLTTAASLLVTSMAIAGNMGTPVPAIWGELSFSAGYFNAHQGKTQHIDINTLVGNTYTVHKQNDGNYLLGGSFFVNGPDYNALTFSYGVKAFYLAKTDVRGHVIQEDFFDNLAYKYSIEQVPIYAMARVMKDSIFQELALVVDGGIGLNIMHMNNYQEYSLDGGITELDYAFYGRTNTKFSATAGVGLKFNSLANHATVEVGYRFFYLGQGSLKPRTDEILNNLKTGSSYANSVVVTVGWLV